MTAAEKDWIDNASHEQLLRKWRFAPSGDPFFTGETGEYYGKALAEGRRADPAGHTQASKNIGWD